MNRKSRILKLSKETLRDLTENKLRRVVGGISGQPIPDSCGYTEGFTCGLQGACSGWTCGLYTACDTDGC